MQSLTQNIAAGVKCSTDLLSSTATVNVKGRYTTGLYADSKVTACGANLIRIVKLVEQSAFVAGVAVAVAAPGAPAQLSSADVCSLFIVATVRCTFPSLRSRCLLAELCEGLGHPSSYKGFNHVDQGIIWIGSTVRTTNCHW